MLHANNNNEWRDSRPNKHTVWKLVRLQIATAYYGSAGYYNRGADDVHNEWESSRPGNEARVLSWKFLVYDRSSLLQQ